MAYVAPTVRSVGDAVTAADYNIMANNDIDLNIARSPVGVVNAFAGSAAPTGWLLCDGSAVSQTTYAALYAVISSTYDVTSPGAGNFRVPDLRGRAVAGKDNMGGTAASRITSGGSSITGTTLGASGGTETHTITTAQMPSHTHDTTFKTNVAGSYPVNQDHLTRSQPGSWDTTNITSGSAGSGNAHQNTQPTIILNYIIKT